MKLLSRFQVFFQFVRLKFCFRRRVSVTAAAPPIKRNRDPHEQVRYVPILIGGQIMPYLIDTRNASRRRDPYD